MYVLKRHALAQHHEIAGSDGIARMAAAPGACMTPAAAVPLRVGTVAAFNSSRRNIFTK
jgi:hypothetical protein